MEKININRPVAAFREDTPCNTREALTENGVACVASVSRVWEQRKTKERSFRYFACAENGARAKKRTVGVGKGKEGNACGQTPGF